MGPRMKKTQFHKTVIFPFFTQGKSTLILQKCFVKPCFPTHSESSLDIRRIRAMTNAFPYWLSSNFQHGLHHCPLLSALLVFGRLKNSYILRNLFAFSLSLRFLLFETPLELEYSFPFQGILKHRFFTLFVVVRMYIERSETSSISLCGFNPH